MWPLATERNNTGAKMVTVPCIRCTLPKALYDGSSPALVEKCDEEMLFDTTTPGVPSVVRRVTNRLSFLSATASKQKGIRNNNRARSLSLSLSLSHRFPRLILRDTSVVEDGLEHTRQPHDIQHHKSVMVDHRTAKSPGETFSRSNDGGICRQEISGFVGYTSSYFRKQSYRQAQRAGNMSRKQHKPRLDIEFVERTSPLSIWYSHCYIPKI